MRAKGRTASAGIARDSHCRLPRAHPNGLFTLNNPVWHCKSAGCMRAPRLRHRRSSACGDTRIPRLRVVGCARRHVPTPAGTIDCPAPVERHRRVRPSIVWRRRHVWHGPDRDGRHLDCKPPRDCKAPLTTPYWARFAPLLASGYKGAAKSGRGASRRRVAMELTR